MAKVNNLAYDYSIYEPAAQRLPEKRIEVKKNVITSYSIHYTKLYDLKNF